MDKSVHLDGADLQVRQSPGKYWGKRIRALILLIWAGSPAIGFEGSLTVLTVVGFGCYPGTSPTRPSGLFGIGVLCTLDAPTSVLLLVRGPWLWNMFNY